MSDVKFTCPSCGIHIQCDETRVGENLPCPGCAHLVRVPSNAELIRSAAAAAITAAASPPTIGPDSVPTLEENFLAEPGKPIPSTAPVTEREQQIAAAREAHAQSNPGIKPRLSFILSGGAAPPPEENHSAVNHGQEKNSDAPRPDDAKSLNE